jgi:serine/threonine protein kinase
MRPDLPAVWDDVIRRSLAKNPDDRYPSAQAMDKAIQAAWEQTQRAQNAPQVDTLAPATRRNGGLSDWGLAIRTFVRSLWSRRRARVFTWIVLVALAMAILIVAAGTWLQPTGVPDVLISLRVYVAENGNDRVAVINPVNNRALC